MSIDDYRLTDADEARIRAALERFLIKLRAEVTSYGHTFDVHAQLSSSFNVTTARRLMMHSIGCDERDLRDVELLFIDNEIEQRRMVI